MSMYYNSSQPINIASKYTAYNVLEFLIKMPTGRAMKKGSLRMSGYLKTFYTNPNGATGEVTGDQGIMFNPYIGVHSLFQNANTTVNGRGIESLQNYPRMVGCITQAQATPEDLVTMSCHATELKGIFNNQLLVGDDAFKGVAFSFKPHIAINKCSEDLAQSKFSEIKIMFQLANGSQAYYCTGNNPAVAAISYELRDLQLSWIETTEPKGLAQAPVTFNSTFSMVQTLTGTNSNIQVNSPMAYDSMFMSFIRQANTNNVYLDSHLSEYISDIVRLEILVNGNDAPISYAITSPVYQDIALNYFKSLSSSGNIIWRCLPGGDKNSIMNKFLSENGTFGIGASFYSSINDKLQVALTLDDNISTANNPSANPIDAFIYVNGYITV